MRTALKVTHQIKGKQGGVASDDSDDRERGANSVGHKP
jgi:hypothetical protein